MSKKTNHQSFSELYSLIGDERNNYDSIVEHRHYFRIAGITVCVEICSDFDTVRFKDELMAFSVDGPGEDNVILRHHFKKLTLKELDLGEQIFRNPPYAISVKDGIWCYNGISPKQDDGNIYHLSLFNSNHTRGLIFNDPITKSWLIKTGWQSLSLFPTDQLWLVPLFAERNAMILHSSAVVINGCGLVFVGQTEAGKTTTVKLFKDAYREKDYDLKILCDDRNIVRYWPEGWYVHGTWSHGDIAEVSPSSAPLRAVLFIEQANENKITQITDRTLIWHKLLATLVRSIKTKQWWQNNLDSLGHFINSANFYQMRFDKTGNIVPLLEKLVE